jgi:histidine triad (HIT) family protein
MKDCTFCKIIAGEAPGDIVYRDEQVTAFHDIHPVAPVHILIVPNEHIRSVNEITSQDEPLVGHMLHVAGKIAKEKKIQESGYRLILNTGPDAGQAVFHLHLHLIGGQHVRYPMG